jgi:hypothetical protein
VAGGRESSVSLLNREIAVLYDSRATGSPHVIVANTATTWWVVHGDRIFQNTWFKHRFTISRLEVPEVCL